MPLGLDDARQSPHGPLDVVVDAGAAGIAVAASLKSRKPGAEIAIIDHGRVVASGSLEADQLTAAAGKSASGISRSRAASVGGSKSK